MIVGVDVGTQSLKVAVTDENLKALGAASTDYQPDFPRSGWAEQHPDLWEEALGPAISAALVAAAIAPDRIAALAIGGQLDGCIPVRDGIATHPCIIRMDRRADAMLADIPAGMVRERTGINVDASHPAAKIAWLKKHRADAARGATFHAGLVSGLPADRRARRRPCQRIDQHAV